MRQAEACNITLNLRLLNQQLRPSPKALLFSQSIRIKYVLNIDCTERERERERDVYIEIYIAVYIQLLLRHLFATSEFC